MTTDVVCILDASLTQLFELARPIKATVKEESKAMEHPLESGAIVTDHRIILPVEIELSLVLSSAEYKDTYSKIRDLYAKGSLLTVQTRTDSYQNMMIEAIPHEETPDAFDAVNMAMTLKEVLFVQAQFSDLKVKNAKDGRTKNRGEQQGQTSNKQSSILSGLFK